MILEMTFEEAWASVEPLFKAQFEETEDSDKFEFNPDLAVFQLMCDQGMLKTFVYLEDGEAVGYYMVTKYPHPHKNIMTAKEECFYVSPKFRNKGVCTSLFSAVEDWLRDQEVEIFYTTIKAGQSDALINKLGFEEEETVYKKYL